MWNSTQTIQVIDLQSPYTVEFDMCAFGMKSPSGVPIMKRTRFLTNSKRMKEASHGHFCNGRHKTHQKISGNDQGHRISRWCQVYPPELVTAMVGAILQERNDWISAA